MTTILSSAASSDADLVARSIEQDREAYRAIVERYQSLICAITYSGCGDLQASEDLAQETFLRAWRHLRELKEPARLRYWLVGIARNLTLSSRRKIVHILGAQPLDENILDPTPLAPSEAAITSEEHSLLWQHLERLPDEYREPLVLFYRHEESVAKVAVALEISEELVRQRLSRGRAMLAERIQHLVVRAFKSTTSTASCILSSTSLADTVIRRQARRTHRERQCGSRIMKKEVSPMKALLKAVATATRNAVGELYRTCERITLTDGKINGIAVSPETYTAILERIRYNANLTRESRRHAKSQVLTLIDGARRDFDVLVTGRDGLLVTLRK